MCVRLLFLVIFLSFVSCFKPEPIKPRNANYFLNYLHTDNKEIYLDSISNLIKLEPNDSLTRELYFNLASCYEELGLYRKFKTNLEQIQRLASLKKDTKHMAKTYWFLGDHNEARQILDSAYYYYLKAEKLYALEKDSILWAKMLSYKAGVLYNTGIYTEAETSTARALQILSKQKQTRLYYEVNLQMALVLKELKEYDAALQYYAKIPELLDLLEQQGYSKDLLQRSQLSYYNNLGSYYQSILDYSKAQEYFEKGLQNKDIDSFPKLKAMLLNNYAYNQMLAKKDPKTIDSLLTLSLEIRHEINHKQGITASLMRSAQFSLLKQDTLQAIYIMTGVYKNALEDQNGYELIKSLKFLAENDIKNKQAYTELYFTKQDSLQTIDRQTRNKFARIAYETSEISKQNDHLNQRNSHLISIILLVALLSFILFVVFSLQMKNKKLLYKQKDQQAIQQIQTLLLQQQRIANKTKIKERKIIAKNLHDSIINRVFTLRINLEQLPSQAQEEKEKLIEQLKQIETQTRALSHDMHKTLFCPEQDFGQILEDIVKAQKNSFQTAFNCSIDKLIYWDLYTLYQKAQLYLILQELLQNVNKHARATTCLVLFILKDNYIQLRVHDNGIGIDPKKVKKGLGFKNITHRLKALNGTLTISSEHNTTTVNVKIPYLPKEKQS
ncbi:tetratricopeptide repeat-containing sensor histidine kinase [Myroides marinus]|uniref:tetratricopeptide repeat-containing sensor histidine kinase n=1 Tax=Myroides marinus TaxID=703342 RepID=UPI00257726AB|nr:tetratricopeptide repeat-containing sensor histidine kinase [Myroides marinus]MDM1362573.1 two-component sensor histidine kinase [Myroides marinus]